MKENYNPWEKLADIIFDELWNSDIKEVIINNAALQLNHDQERNELTAWLQMYNTNIIQKINNNSSNEKLKSTNQVITKILENVNSGLTETNIKDLVSLAFIGLDEVRNEFYYIYYKSNIIPTSTINQTRKKARVPYGYGSIGFSVREGFEIPQNKKSQSNESDICLGDMRNDPRTRVNFTDYILGNKSFLCVPLYDYEHNKPKYICSIAIFLPIRNIWACGIKCPINSPQVSISTTKKCALEIFKKIIYNEKTLLNIFTGTQYSISYRFVDVIQKVFSDYNEITKINKDEKSWVNEILDNIVLQNKINEPYQDIIGSMFCFLYEEIANKQLQFRFSNCTISQSHFMKDIADVVNMNMIISKNHHPDYHIQARNIKKDECELINVLVKEGSLGYEWAIGILYNYFDEIKELIMPIHNTKGVLVGIIKIVCINEFISIKRNIGQFIHSNEWKDFVKVICYFEEIKNSRDFENADEIIKDVYEISTVLYDLLSEYIFQTPKDRRKLLKDIFKIITPNLHRVLTSKNQDYFSDVKQIQNIITIFLTRFDESLAEKRNDILAISLWTSTYELNNKQIFQISHFLYIDDKPFVKHEFLFAPNYKIIESIINEIIPCEFTEEVTTIRKDNIFLYSVSFPFKNVSIFHRRDKLITVFHNDINQDLIDELKSEINSHENIFKIDCEGILSDEPCIVIGWEKNYRDRLNSLYVNMSILNEKLEVFLSNNTFKIKHDAFEKLFLDSKENNDGICLNIIKNGYDREFDNQKNFIEEAISIRFNDKPFEFIEGFDFIKEIASYINIDYLNIIPLKTNGITKLILLGHRASSKAGWLANISDNSKKFNKIESDKEVATFLRLILTLIENRLFQSFSSFNKSERLSTPQSHIKHESIKIENNLLEVIKKFKVLSFDNYRLIENNYTLDGYISYNHMVKEELKKINDLAEDDRTTIIVAPSKAGKSVLFKLLAKKYLLKTGLVEVPEDRIVTVRLNDPEMRHEDTFQKKLFGHLSNKNIVLGEFHKSNNGVLIFDEFGRGNNQLIPSLESFIRKERNTFSLHGCSEDDQQINTKFILVSSYRIDQDKVLKKLGIPSDCIGRVIQNLILIPDLDQIKETIPIMINYFLFNLLKSNGFESVNIQIPLTNEEYKSNIIDRKYDWDNGYHLLNKIVKKFGELILAGNFNKSTVLDFFSE